MIRVVELAKLYPDRSFSRLGHSAEVGHILRQTYDEFRGIGRSRALQLSKRVSLSHTQVKSISRDINKSTISKTET